MASTKLILPKGVKYNGVEGEVDLSNLPKRSYDELQEMGDSGTVVFSGIISDIDYVQELQDSRRFDIYDRMRLGDDTIGPALRARKAPILQAEDGFKPASDEKQDIEIKQFVEWNLRHNLYNRTGLRRTWDEVIRQSMLDLDFGVMAHELVWKGWEMWEGKRRFILGDISPRLPKTIDYWWLKTPEPTTGQYGIRQCLDGGDGVENYQPFIPLEVPLTKKVNLRKLVVVTNRKEGDNFQGYSELRNAYGSWMYKKNLLKFDAIKHEKQSMGIVYAIIPRNFDGKAKVQEMLRNVRNNSQLHALIEANKDEVEFGFVDMKAGSTSKPIDSALIHNENIGRALLVGFLFNRSVGSNARTIRETDFFLLMSNEDKERYEAMVNEQIIPSIVNANYPGYNKYPTYFKGKIKLENNKEFAESLSKLKQSGFLDVDRHSVNMARKRYGLPEVSEDEWEKIENGKDEMKKMLSKSNKKKENEEEVESIECGSEGNKALNEEISKLFLETKELVNG